MTEDDTSPGWDAIDDALDTLYPGVTPKHLGTLIKWSLGGPDPIDGISIYPRPDHWHFITYGMSELYTKESDDPTVSGWGFEFTIRVARSDQDTEPPIWAANFLQNLGRYVFTSGNVFEPGHHLDLNGPIALNHPDTRIRAATFAIDPELGRIETPHGSLAFLQVVGITPDEYAAIEAWDATTFLDLAAERLPLLITDVARASVLDDPDTAALVERGIARDGSSTGALFVQEASWHTGPGGTVLTFGANAAERIGRITEARLAHGKGLEIAMAEGGVRLVGGERSGVSHVGDGYIEVTLPQAARAEFALALRPVAGSYPLATAKGLSVEIVRSQIVDQDGTVVREVG